jgi:hypothetical protein
MAYNRRTIFLDEQTLKIEKSLIYREGTEGQHFPKENGRI